MKPHIFFRFLLSASILIIFWSCSSDKLSRGKAEAILTKALKSPYDDLREFKLYANQIGEFGGSDRSNDFGDLSDEGLITYTTKTSTEFYVGGLYFIYIADITEKGKQYVEGDVSYSEGKTFVNNKYVKVKTSKMEFGEITGIAENKESNSAKIDYTLIRKNITPFGRIVFKLKEETINSSAILIKYDDGWRIQK